MENRHSYYLLDNQILYYPAIQLVKHPDGETQLTHFQHKLLMYFLQNPGVVRTQEEICQQVWPNKITTVDAFNKPLGAIRNALSNNEKSKKNDYIKTLSREGYKLACKCEYIANEKQHRLIEKWLKPTGLITAGALLTIVLALQFVRQGVYEVSNSRRAIHLTGTFAEPSLSEDGSWLAFTRYNEQHQGQIFAKQLSKKDHVVLTENYNDKMPAISPSGRRLLFQRLTKNQCQIRMLTLSEALKVQNNELLTHCSPTSFFVSMSWHDDNAFYYTNSTTDAGPYSIYHFNLNNKLSTLYLSPEVRVSQKHIGFARVVYHRKSEKLYIINSPDWLNSNILLHHRGKLSTVATANTPIASIGIFNDSVIYKDASNRFILGSQSKSLIPEFNRPIQHPVTSQNSNKIAYYQGHIYQWNIHAYNIANGKTQQLTFKNARNRYPIKTQDDFYFSSDFTGISQVYRKAKNSDEQPIQLSNFTSDKEITQLTLAQDGKTLALSYGDETQIYAISGQSLHPLHRRLKGTHPSFSLDSKRLMLVTLNDKGLFNSTEYQLSDLTPTGLTIDDALFALYHDSGIVYAKSNEPGLYLFINGRSQTIDKDIRVFKPAHIALAVDHLYAVDRSDKADRHVRKIALSGDSVSKLPIKNPGHLYYFKGQLYYTLEQLGETDIYVGEIIER